MTSSVEDRILEALQAVAEIIRKEIDHAYRAGRADAMNSVRERVVAAFSDEAMVTDGFVAGANTIPASVATDKPNGRASRGISADAIASAFASLGRPLNQKEIYNHATTNGYKLSYESIGNELRRHAEKKYGRTSLGWHLMEPPISNPTKEAALPAEESAA